ncbi:MAG: type I-B CRISPR-associated protein Cas8b1/Cst1 [Anaerolineae bacterium]
MLSYTGHPFVDVGVATIAAFADKRDPAALTKADLDQAADYMQRNYTVDPLKSFLTVAFPNSGFTQPAYNTQPEKRQDYARRVLRGYGAEVPKANSTCVFTGKPAIGFSLDLKDGLEPGRTFRQHVPLLTGEAVINFHPYGDPGLPVSGEALLAIQAMPLGCAKVAGRLLAVHADDPSVTYAYARRFLEQNRKAILAAQAAGDKKLAEYPRRASTLVVETLVDLARERAAQAEEGNGVSCSITAYHFTNSGQGVDLNIYHLPLEISGFVMTAMSAKYRRAWEALCHRGWEVWGGKRNEPGDFAPRYNVLYEDLFRLPLDAALFIRRYFLRMPERTVRPGDPRAVYSVRDDVDLISWPLTELFLRKVVNMKPDRTEAIRQLGDVLADYVVQEGDRRFFDTLLMARRYDVLRSALIRVSVARIKRGAAPVVGFDSYMAAFEEGQDLPYSDWRLARDLLLIRMIEQLYGKGWLQKHADGLPLPDSGDETESAQ